MIAILRGQILSVREISGIVKISEKEVYEHLAHIQRGIQGQRSYRSSRMTFRTPGQAKFA